MNGLFARTVIALTAAAAAVALVPGQALAAGVGCGDVITADTRLDSDLIGCPGIGLVIAADDVSLDLDGHVISGAPGSEAGIENGGLSGPGHDGVTIKDGFVQGFRLGIRVSGASGNVVRDLTVSDVDASGIVLFGGSRHNRLEHNVLIDNLNGIGLDGADQNRLERNFFSSNARGIALFDSDDNHIRVNDVRDSEFAGIYLFGSSEDALEE
jgi:parallel beta-helix repeat protein